MQLVGQFDVLLVEVHEKGVDGSHGGLSCCRFVRADTLMESSDVGLEVLHCGIGHNAAVACCSDLVPDRQFGDSTNNGNGCSCSGTGCRSGTACGIRDLIGEIHGCSGKKAVGRCCFVFGWRRANRWRFGQVENTVDVVLSFLRCKVLKLILAQDLLELVLKMGSDENVEVENFAIVESDVSITGEMENAIVIKVVEVVRIFREPVTHGGS